MIGRARELKLKEIPYFVTHPRLIINLLYRERVKRVMGNLQAERKVETVCTTLSMIEPSHPIAGNFYAERTCRERIDVLKTHRVEFTRLLNRNDPITENLLDKLLKSTLPIQCVFDKTRKKYISFDGTGRLFALKSFFQKEFPRCDPKIEISVFHVHPDLLKRAISW